MTKKTRNWLLASSIVAFPFVLFLGFLIFLEEPLPPPAPLPNPNGYDDLVKAGNMLHRDTGIFSETNLTQLRQIVPTNAAALVLARTALSNQCRVPVQYSVFFVSNHISDLIALKYLALAFIAEGRLAEAEGRTNDAVQSYLDVIHLGNQSPRGGFLIDELVGIAIKTIGTDHLQKLIPHLDANACRNTATVLETLDSGRQTWNEVARREKAWSYHSFRGWQDELMRWAERLTVKDPIAASRRKFNEQQQKMRLLIINIAARAYELDKGHPPASAADLVPDYLKAIPQDPVTGKNLGLQ